MNNENISVLNVHDMVSVLSMAYVELIKNNTPFKDFPSVMLWGAPGVGKSQGVRQIANKIEQKTGKRVCITDVRLLLFNPIDLRGIPTANEDKTLAVWLRPKIFQMDDNDDVVNILFLDEISAAPQSVQAAAYQITLDRTVGEHKLPDNCIVIAAGNRVTDKSVAYNMPKALANRLCHMEIQSSEASWHDWAVSKNINPMVVGYLEYNSPMLMGFESSGSSLAFATPRSWEMVSNIMSNVSSNIDVVYPLVRGCVGFDAASSFRRWCELYSSMPSMERVFSNEKLEIPKVEEFYIALRSLMVNYAYHNPSKENVDSSIDFACRLPFNFRKKLMHDYYQIEALRDFVRENPVFKDAIKKGLQ